MRVSEKACEIGADLACIQTSISNVYLIGNREAWVLADTGVVGYADLIRRACEGRFGMGAKPLAIVLTHGHFDHSAGAMELAKLWGVPVYAHRLEFPYLTGESAYPKKDPTVGGAMAFLSRFFPNRTNNISEVLRELPASGELPGMPEWRVLFTPGHAPGHVSFWRESDGALIAGDALATADLDSWYGLVGRHRKVSRPPSPFTFDWLSARNSVRLLAALRPAILACGHREPMHGPHVAGELAAFADTFAAPAHGRYVSEPATTNEHGVIYEPPAPKDHLPKIAAGVVAGLFLVAGAFFRKRGKRALPGRED